MRLEASWVVSTSSPLQLQSYNGGAPNSGIGETFIIVGARELHA